MGDEANLLLWSSASSCPKSILPVGQGTHDAKNALGGNNSNQEQVNDSEVEVTDKGPTAKMPDPNQRQGSEIKQHHAHVQNQYYISQTGRKRTHSIFRVHVPCPCSSYSETSVDASRVRVSRSNASPLSGNTYF